MHYSQGNGVHTPLSRLVLYPRSVCVSNYVGYCVCGLPTARLCAVEDDNNKDICVHQENRRAEMPAPIHDHLNNHPA